MPKPEHLPADHPDAALLNPIFDEIVRSIPVVSLPSKLAERMDSALEIALDPVRTARTKISDLDRVEKTFIGLLVEQQIRDLLGIPKGRRRDLIIGGVEVDVKCTVTRRTGWMIPTETYREEGVCLLTKIDDERRLIDVGLLVARGAYLGAEEGNRDKKRTVRAAAVRNILWIALEQPLPPSKWEGIDMSNFRALRQRRGGSRRAAEFFRGNLRRAIHRDVLWALLYDQLDYAKRVRGNSGAKDILARERIAIRSGKRGNADVEAVGLPRLSDLEFIAIDARTDEEARILFP